jgi:hypothetical protein
LKQPYVVHYVFLPLARLERDEPQTSLATDIMPTASDFETDLVCGATRKRGEHNAWPDSDGASVC